MCAIETKQVGLAACARESQTREAGTGAKGKRFYSGAHVGEWWTPLSKTISRSGSSLWFLQA